VLAAVSSAREAFDAAYQRAGIAGAVLRRPTARLPAKARARRDARPRGREKTLFGLA
jgi:hypothetical protein